MVARCVTPRTPLWCASQLKNEAAGTLAQRIARSTTWLKANLVGRDLVFIGFWSDWAYLNGILLHTIEAERNHLVILVDPDTPERLRVKAQDLWAWAEKQQRFAHVQASGADFLDELRGLYCRSFLNRCLSAATPTYTALSGGEPATKAIPENLITEDLFHLRRDMCGQPRGAVATQKRPDLSMAAVGAVHLMLLNQGAVLAGARYRIAQNRIRVVNGAGRILSQVRALFSQEPPSPEEDTTVICAGAIDDGGAPPNILGGTSSATIIRPGSSARWVTAVEAKNLDFSEGAA